MAQHAETPHHDGTSGALGAHKCTTMHTVLAVQQEPGTSVALVGMPGTFPCVAACPLAPARAAGHPCGARAAPVPSKLWDSAVLEQWAAAIAAPSLQVAHMGLGGPHDTGVEFIRQVLDESQKVWLAHAGARACFVKARVGPRRHDGVGSGRTSAAPVGRGAGCTPGSPELHSIPHHTTPCRTAPGHILLCVCHIAPGWVGI